jgi:hypothetical protein
MLKEAHQAKEKPYQIKISMYTQNEQHQTQ